MPTYDYKCSKCDFKIEIYHAIPVGTYNHHKEYCLECLEEMEKQISKPSGIHFKGSGFYETDYKGKT